MKLGLVDVMPCLFYNDPGNFLDYFKNSYKHKPFINRCIQQNRDNDSNNHIIIDFDINALYQLIYDETRFAEITTLVVDYSMPGINGLELCQQIRKLNKYIKIIMLTGEADKELAVHAFNEGLINKFITKNTSNIMEQVLQDINEQQNNYFLELSEILLNQTTKLAKQILLHLDDTSYINLLNTTCQKHNIVEYYVINNSGSMLLLNQEAKLSWLAIANNEQMNGFYTTAEFWHTSKAILEALKLKQKIPFIFSADEDEISPNKWDLYMYPAKQLIGQCNYYYAYIDNYKDSINKDKILSLSRYLNI